MNVNKDKLLRVLKLTSQIILESGGETYRAEETCSFICKSLGAEVDSYATPTGIYITVIDNNLNERTVIKRIKKRSIDLTKLDCVNTISRRLTSEKITVEEALEQLEELRRYKAPKKKLSFYYDGISAGFFTLLFGGGLVDFVAAFMSGLVIHILGDKFSRYESYQFFTAVLGGAVIALLAVITQYAFKTANFNSIIVGSMMPLLPGLAMTNAIRDAMRGDLVSGLARGAEAGLIAASLAVGAGIIISVSIYLGILSI